MASVKSFILVLAAVACTAAPAFAQSEGRVSVGASITVNATTDDDVDSTIGIGPLVRLNPHKGWGPAGAFNWFRADLQDPAGGDSPFGRLRVRPLMAGVAYTVGNDTVLTSFSIVGGPSFNKADFDDDFTRAAGASIDADNSFAVRPGVGITWTVAPRVAIIGFGGYLVNRPDVTYRDRNGAEFKDRWKADSVVLSVGAVYSIF
jgi:outer membrane protein with beta-barrel domain